ncbi:ABC transporter permease [Streptomyces sp. NPDC052023]|uniref:ABC transporter permease n=1 Tax=Streptomyces sp. NPDC052023 TaxID=3365681 RepID=UPI0037D66F1E
MPFLPVLHAEWLKIRTLRSLCGTLFALCAVSTVFSALAGTSSTPDPEFDPLSHALSGILLGQIAAIAFGAMAVSAEYHGDALRLSLAAAPRRGRWFTAKLTAIALPTLLVGLFTTAASLAAGRSAMGDAAAGLTAGQQVRGVVGGGLYLMLMALFAAGLTALLRSGTAALGILVPFILIVSFVIGDAAGGAVDFMPDRAGRIVMHATWDGTPGPWTGLAVTAVWTGVALAAGAWSVRRRDA